MVDFKDVKDVDQIGKFAQIKADYNDWKVKWSKGSEWGIVGGATGTGKRKPKTVLSQALMHGEPDYARDQARTITGIGELLTAISEVLDGDLVLFKDKKALEKAVKQMLAVLRKPEWNPRNIPFRTVVKFTEGDDPKKPTIERADMFGHYRTKAYNDFAVWSNEHKGTDIQIADAKEEWSNEATGQAKPPLWRAISQETDDGILHIAKALLEALEDVTLKDNPDLPIYSNKESDIATIAEIQSVRDKVIEVVNTPTIYPSGKGRAPVKERLNRAFSGQTYALANTEEADNLTSIKGWDEIVGYDKTKSVQLYFPRNNKALVKLIRLVLGDEIDTYETPKARSGEAKPGLIFTSKERSGTSWEDIVKVNEVEKGSSLEEMMTKKYRCHNPQCPFGPPNSSPEVPVTQARTCRNRFYSKNCVGYRMR